jgi:hypothetical protein
MNCLYETLAEIYLRTRARFIPEPEDTVCDAEENLEACRASLAAKERDVSVRCTELARDALRRRNAGDLPAARLHLQERRRCTARLEKLRNGVALLDKQLDALRSSELDKELMHSLRVSSQAMKKAGIGIGVEEAETVMNELDDQIREASDITSLLATPLMHDENDADESEIDAELALLCPEPQPESNDDRDAPAEHSDREPERAPLLPPVRRLAPA